MRQTSAFLVILWAFLALGEVHPADWPEWRGPGRLGLWEEDGILEKFPETGPVRQWETPIRAGYAGPAVVEGRVFITDFTMGSEIPTRGTERAICLEEETGKIIWERPWPADYGVLNYNSGPRATPTVDADRVYILGAMGNLLCLNAKSGEVLWTKDYMKDFGAQPPIWGFAAAPIVYKNLLICLSGADKGGKLIALDKMTGAEAWRALDPESEPGYVAPMIIHAGRTDQLIVWEPQALNSINPLTGEIFWQQEFAIKMNAPLASPVWKDDRLFVTAFYNGPMMMKLDADSPKASMVWRGKSDSELKTDGLHACHSTPLILGDHIFGICSFGQFRCLDANTGQRVWESMDITLENKRWSSAFIVQHKDRFFINNDRGELIICKLGPEGYTEIDRAKLIVPTTSGAGKRELEFVNWTHPAYANRHLVTRNDEQIIRVSLAAEGK